MSQPVGAAQAGRQVVRRLAALRRLSDRTPLRIKLIAAVLALVTLALSAAGAAASTALRRSLLQRVDGQLQSTTGQLVGAGEHRFVPGPGAGPDGLQLPSDYYIRVNDATGKTGVTVSNPDRKDQSPPKLSGPTLQQAVARAGDPFTAPPQGDGASWRALVTPLPDGSGSITVAMSLADVDNTLARLRFLQLVTGLVVLALLGGMAYLVVRNSLRPLVEVERTAAAIAGGDLGRRVPDRDARTEVGRLSAALNGMLVQIEAAFRTREASERAARESEDRMRRFVADASHELRTPLTSIRGFAELYRQGAVGSPGDIARLMRRIEDEAARMGLLVDDLLLLARLDQQRPLERAPVDLLTIASDAVHDARVVAPSRPITLELLADPNPPVVVGDEFRLRQVVGNLVNNALVHTPDDAVVTVRVGARPGQGSGAGGSDSSPAGSGSGGSEAVLEVADRGPGLGPEQAERVFERFYRADLSRTRSQGGTGLRLSIVSALVTAHGGRLEVETAPGAGATFRVLLPLAEQPSPPPVEPPSPSRPQPARSTDARRAVVNSPGGR